MPASEDVSAYFAQPMPGFLKPVTAMPLFSRVDGEGPEPSGSSEDSKYEQYFAKLALDGSAYRSRHQVWRPNVKIHAPCKDDGADSLSFQSVFGAFLNVPTLMYDSPLTGLSYHTSVQMPDGLHVFGGLRGLGTEEYLSKMRRITKDFSIKPQNIALKFDCDLPFPLEKDKLASIAHEAFRFHCRYDPGCNSIQTLVELKKQDEDASTAADAATAEESLSTGSSAQSSGLSGLKVPIPLCCASAVKISERFFILYGGFDLVEEITYPDAEHCIIEKKMICSDQFWVFDCLALKYKEIKLCSHPTFSSLFPNSIPRFGHEMVAVTVEETNDKSNLRGGLVLSDLDPTSPTGLSNWPSENDNSGSYNQTPAKHPSTPLEGVTSHSTGTEPYLPQDTSNKNLNTTNTNSNTNVNTNHTSSTSGRYLRSRRNNSHFSKPAILFVCGGYTSHKDKPNFFFSLNDLWKCEIFIDENGVSDEIVCCPIGAFEMSNNSFCINQRGERYPKKNTELFEEVFEHVESDGTQWPLPRGFFAFSMIEKDNLGKHLLDIIAKDSSEHPTQITNSYLAAKTSSPISSIASPVPKSTPTSPLNNNGNNNDIGKYFSTGSPVSFKSQAKPKNSHTQQLSINRVSSPNGKPSLNEFSRTSPLSLNYENDRNISSSSPYSEDVGIHTSQISALSNKILLAHGGSSIMDTKVINEETNEEFTFYNKRILGDFWIFDFQSEKWYPYETFYKGAIVVLNICGHLMDASIEHLAIYGGIQEKHYREKEFEPKVFDSNIPSNQISDEIWQTVSKFLSSIRYKHNLSDSDCKNTKEFQRRVGLSFNDDPSSVIPVNCYTSFVLNLSNKSWNIIDYAFVRDTKFSKQWESLDDGDVISGGVRESPDQYYDNPDDCPFYIIYTVSYLGKFDSRLVAMVTDLHLIDKETNLHSDSRQCFFANGITEVYSFLSTF